ncbi:MAG: FtsX-like permease family protein [Alphaproteobacteria bacterium]|jgi:putative ABC transport system permease protein|nr:FtsX-like permease family protein [Alphaproteobacteria bacterium]MBT4018407.1 FtsX-like permease family protein [Alphaproteobacteria bacterium]MBT5160304.1 FtsX-like permease family protein [Alphaproteobacteria bacterium]MBT5917489.1 FtsX-like permease family protein [Alphaproteobacteria bacterium]MBT6387227.1 FtsX-like permease family protein [Alphaproteobacteria bacterium]
MRPLDWVLAAFDSLRANILRTALTTLGIVIGVASVIAMVSVGAGAEQRVQSVIQSLGANILIVLNGSSTAGGVRGGAGSRFSLTEDDARALQQELPAIAIAAANVRGTGQVIFGNTNWFTTIYGANTGYLEAREWVVASGRNFSPADERSAAKVAIVGQSIVDNVFAGNSPLGQTIRIKRVPFTVIGLMAEKGQTPMGSDQDDVVFVPLSTAKKRILGGARLRGKFVGAITLKAARGDLIREAERQAKELLRVRHRIQPGQRDDFTVRNIASILEARASSQRTMAYLLAAVAGVSLIVGGIGIMNIMLVSVTERTREIGLRMAVGARGRDIMIQFVIEAVALSLIGGIIGIALGAGGSVLAAKVAGWPLIFSLWSVVLAIVFSAAVGVFFGYYPALKASRLDPIEALRHD